MFKKILIANRGEIAVRIIRSCMELGIETVAIYSEGDEDSLHVKLADSAVKIGKAPAKDSYLKFNSIISAAEITDVDAIHPGYGFLSENPEFAKIVEENGFVFIGPNPEIMKLMGDKSKAKEIMRNAGLPVIPGSDGEIKDVEEALQLARSIGYPVLIKASYGGGGKGMRLAYNDEELKTGFRMAQIEAKAAFGNEGLYMEKFILEPRHIEIQLIGDKKGNIFHVGERECSIQRRHQKLIEESPSVAVNEDLRRKMGEAAIKGAKAVGYNSAGTIEFLLDKDKNFYFMEMNTRIQVEHPVSEMVSGADLIKEQILVAAGESLTLRENLIHPQGHSIECRINAEDPDKNFRPSPGTIKFLHLPGGPGIRVDSHIFAGYKIPPYYDSLIAKLIAYGRDREEARLRMKRALLEFYIEGISTTIPFHLKIMDHEEFIKGNLTTDFISKYIKTGE